MITHHVMDFETFSFLDLKKTGAWAYAEHPTTEILCLVFEGLDGKRRLWVPADQYRHDAKSLLVTMALDEEIMWVSHGDFERAIWKEIMVARYDFPEIPNYRWNDTMAISAMKNLPLGLDNVLRVLDLPGKDKEGSALIKAIQRPNRKGDYDLVKKPEVLDKVYSYCDVDVDRERQLLDRVGWLQRGERKVWLLDQKINQRGVGIDMDFVNAAQQVIDGAMAPLAKEFSDLTGGLKISQAKEIVKWANNTSGALVLKNLQKQTVADALGTDPDEDDNYGPLTFDELRHERDGPQELLPPVRRVLEIRQVAGSASIKKLEAVRRCVCMDGSARGLLQYHVGGTGRFGGRLIQPQNFPRPTTDELQNKQEEVAEIIMTGDYRLVEEAFGPAIPAVVSNLRSILVARDGKLLNQGDYKGVEARILYKWCGQDNKAQLMASGADVYSDMGSQIYGYPVNKKEHPVERDMGKHAVLGLGYGMGGKTFMSRYARDKELDFCKGVVNVYRKDWAPCVPKFWYALEDASLRAVENPGKAYEAFGITYCIEGEFLTARLPSDRKLYYPHPETTFRPVPWDKTEFRKTWFYWAQRQGVWQPIDAFGGLLTGHAVQAVARDLLVYSMFKLEENNFPVVLTCHDEDVCEVPEAQASAEIVREIMCDIPDWAREIGFVIDADCPPPSWRYKK